MTLTVEQRALAQSDQTEIVVLGPNPTGAGDVHTLTEGAYKILGARPGLTVSLFDIVVGDDFSGKFVTEPCVAIDILFEAAGRGWLLDAEGATIGAVPYRPGRIYVMVARRGAEGLYDVPIGTRFKGMDIRVDMALWARLDPSGTISRLDDGHSLHAMSGNDTWVGLLPLAPKVTAAARSLFESGMKADEDLAIEARCLDIIAAVIEGLKAEKSTVSAAETRDRRLLQRARDLLLADLPRPWTIECLAQEAGLTQKRLKAGFPVVHGMPVYAFLQEERLQAAHRLLAAGKQSVTQIAHCVGYSNASHFSRIFGRRFGMKPSDVVGAGD